MLPEDEEEEAALADSQVLLHGCQVGGQAGEHALHVVVQVLVVNDLKTVHKTIIQWYKWLP
jgi:hypothetical protein